MNRHLKIMFAVSIVLAMVLSACGPKPTEAPVEEKTKVAVLFPGVVTDQSWNQFGYEGLKRAEEECGVEIGYSEDVSQDEQIEVWSCVTMLPRVMTSSSAMAANTTTQLGR
jgi:basic membrane lipoprotein Med (substrate-binding protein (PBP1-ABC) superfamily)